MRRSRVLNSEMNKQSEVVWHPLCWTGVTCLGQINIAHHLLKSHGYVQKQSIGLAQGEAPETLLLTSYATPAAVRVVQGSACSHTEEFIDHEIRRIDDSVHNIVHSRSIISTITKLTSIWIFSKRWAWGDCPFASLNAASANREKASQCDRGFKKSQCCCNTL